MSIRLLLPCALCLWAGTTLLLGAVPAFGRMPLHERIAPFVPVPGIRRGRRSAGSGELIAEGASAVGAWFASVLGERDDLATRLRRIHSDVDPETFRLRQLGWAVAGGMAACAVAVVVRAPAAVSAGAVPFGVAASYWVTESRLTGACRASQRRRLLELPIIAEQLAMLVSAGYSTSAALGRVAARGAGACAADLRVVRGRLGQGVDEASALREWAAVVRLPELDRLVAVLCLARETSDLGRLLSGEARAIRRNVQRQTVEIIERRAQQVWIPVTVAALVPGSIFLAVPFVSALRMFSGG